MPRKLVSLMFGAIAVASVVSRPVFVLHRLPAEAASGAVGRKKIPSLWDGTLALRLPWPGKFSGMEHSLCDYRGRETSGDAKWTFRERQSPVSTTIPVTKARMRALSIRPPRQPIRD